MQQILLSTFVNNHSNRVWSELVSQPGPYSIQSAVIECRSTILCHSRQWNPLQNVIIRPEIVQLVKNNVYSKWNCVGVSTRRLRIFHAYEVTLGQILRSTFERKRAWFWLRGGWSNVFDHPPLCQIQARSLSLSNAELRISSFGPS